MIPTVTFGHFLAMTGPSFLADLQKDVIATITAKQPTLRKLQAALARIIAPFLQAQAGDIARQIGTMRVWFGKAALTPEQQRTIDNVLAALEFSGWAVLADEVEPILEAIAQEASRLALLQVGIDVSADPEVQRVVNAKALAYARQRSAAMVGMRRNELGQLWPNPDAKWQITESTREGVRAAVRRAIDEGLSNDDIANELRDAYAFSKSRAMVIARTETQMATQTGALEGYKASGLVDGKQWLTAEDDKVSPECAENGEAGPDGNGVLMDLDARYPSGDIAPPTHPNCRCAIAPFILWNKPGDAGIGV